MTRWFWPGSIIRYMVQHCEYAGLYKLMHNTMTCNVIIGLCIRQYLQFSIVLELDIHANPSH